MLWIQLVVVYTLYVYGWSTIFIVSSVGFAVFLTPETQSVGWSIKVGTKFFATLVFGLTYQLIMGVYGETKHGFMWLFSLTALLNLMSLIMSISLDGEKLGKKQDDDARVIAREGPWSIFKVSFLSKRM